MIMCYPYNVSVGPTEGVFYMNFFTHAFLGNVLPFRVFLELREVALNC